MTISFVMIISFNFFPLFPWISENGFFLKIFHITRPDVFSIVAIRKVIKRELIVYIKACKTKALSLVQLKKSLVALTVFETRNEDVLIALKTTQTSQDSPLRQNALAEILFARLPKTIQQFLTSNTDTIIKKLSLKMSHLNLSPRHIMNLMGYIHKRMNPDDLCKTLSRIDGVAMKISIPQEAKNRLHDYLESLKKNMDRAPLVYRALFLIPELETFQKLYRPTRVMESVETVTEKTIRQYTLSSTLEFHVTKDHFDLIKSKYSSDCTDTYLGEKQLMTPFFFNIRIFKDEEWIGNIYMLDFSEEHNSLIIDRVQMPRELEASYYQFFDYLKEILIEMFKDVHYKYILMPLRISNHESIQRMFNHYKKGLSKKGQFINSSYSFNFESLSGRKSYYVLYKQTKA